MQFSAKPAANSRDANFDTANRYGEQLGKCATDAKWLLGTHDN
jgi:hypothetical protein